MASKVTSNSAWKDYQTALKAKPGEFKFSGVKPVWEYDDSTLNKYYDALLNRKDFSFDLNNNALYNQYKDFYTKQGQLAMIDTIGQASSMTGGFGNSFAAAAGQQAYQQNLDKLGEMVPEIYGLALQQYQVEGEQLYNKYALAAGERDVAYNQFLDNLNQYYTDYDMAYQQHSDSVDRWYNDVDMAYGIYGDARDYEYQVDRAAAQDAQWQKEFAAQQAARDRDYEMWQKEFEAQQAARDREQKRWEKEFNAEYGGVPLDSSESEQALDFVKKSAGTINKVIKGFIGNDTDLTNGQFVALQDTEKFFKENGITDPAEKEYMIDYFVSYGMIDKDTAEVIKKQLNL